MKIYKYFSTVMVSFLVIACTTANTTTQSQKEIDGSWTLGSLKGNPINRMVVLPTLKIDLSVKVLSGDAGCNVYSAPIVNHTGNKLTLDPIAVSQRMCDRENIETEYVRALSDISTYKVKDNSLYFYNAKGENILMFIRTK